MLRLANIVETAINPALAMLPAKMDTKGARVQLLATGLQESRFEHRAQIVYTGRTVPGPDGKAVKEQVKGPARSFWQMERGGGCAGLVRHPASRDLMKQVCIERGCAFTALAIWNAIENDDVLAAAAARLLYWTDPKPLPAIGDAGGAWDYYIRVWRPGKPHPSTWPALYAQAVAEVTGG